MKLATTEVVPLDYATARWEDEGGAVAGVAVADAGDVSGGVVIRSRRVEQASGLISPFAIPALFFSSTGRWIAYLNQLRS